MSNFTDSFVNALSLLAEPFYAVKQLEGAMQNIYSSWCGHTVTKLDAAYEEKSWPVNEQVPEKTRKLMKQFFTEKGIDASKILLRKREAKYTDDTEYSQWGSLELHNICVIAVPFAAIARIENENTLSNTDKFILLHEYGHNVNNDYGKAKSEIPLKIGSLRLGTYAVSVMLLSNVCPLPLSHFIASAIARLSGFLFQNKLTQDKEFKADEFAAKFSKQDLNNGIAFFRKEVERNKSIGNAQFFKVKADGQIEDFVFTDTGELHFPQLHKQPSPAARLAALEKLSSEILPDCE